MAKHKWIKTSERPPDNQPLKSRRYYMAYNPDFSGYIFKCSYNKGFNCGYVESRISGVTHYRLANKGEKDRQLDKNEIMEINNG